MQRSEHSSTNNDDEVVSVNSDESVEDEPSESSDDGDINPNSKKGNFVRQKGVPHHWTTCTKCGRIIIFMYPYLYVHSR